MAYQELFKFNPNHDERGRFTYADAHAATLTAGDGDHPGAQSIAQTALGGHYPEYQRVINDLNQKLEAGQATKSLYSKNGNGTGGYTRERLATHREILKTLFAHADRAKPPPGQKPTLYMLGGRGGSGKSQFDSQVNPDVGVYDSRKTLVLDPDSLKAALGSNGQDAALFHEESKDLLQKAANLARAQGLNVAIDRTMRSPDNRTIDPWKKAGYQIVGAFMRLSPAEAAKRAATRWLNGPNGGRGRLVPIDAVLKNTNNERNFDRLIPHLDRWSVYDNSGSRPVLKMRGGY